MPVVEATVNFVTRAAMFVVDLPNYRLRRVGDAPTTRVEVPHVAGRVRKRDDEDDDAAGNCTAVFSDPIPQVCSVNFFLASAPTNLATAPPDQEAPYE